MTSQRAVVVDVPASTGPSSPVGGLVLAMVVAPWAYVVANALYAWMIRDGGSDSTGAGSLEIAAQYPDTTRTLLVLVVLGGLLMVPALLGMMRLTPYGTRGARLARFGAGAMVLGYLCYSAVGFTGYIQVAMAERGGPVDDYAAVLDASMRDPAALWVFLVFVFGNLIGTLVLVAGLLRAGAVPRWVAVCIASWPVLHVFGLTVMTNELPQVVGATLMAAGFAGAGRVLATR